MRSIAIGIGVAIALVLHVWLGWIWSIAGSLFAGFMVKKANGLAGAVVLLVSWALLIGWNLAVAPSESVNMMETMGDLLGGMPGFVIPVATLLMAALLGFFSGRLGGALKPKKAS